MGRPGQAWDWRQANAVVDPSQGEVIGASLWHRVTYVSSTTTRLTFFDVVPANRRIGNLNIAGQLPAGVSFRIQVIRCVAFVGPQTVEALAAATDPITGTLNDLFSLYTEGVFSLDILNKRYAEYPMYMLPPGAGMAAGAFSAGDTAAGTSLAQSGSWCEPNPRSVFTLAVPIVIPPQTNFTTVLEWPAGAQTLAGGNTDIAVVLDGQLLRPVQ